MASNFQEQHPTPPAENMYVCNFRAYGLNENNQDVQACVKNPLKTCDVNICSCSYEDHCTKSIAQTCEHYRNCRHRVSIPTRIEDDDINLQWFHFHDLIRENKDAKVDVVIILDHSNALFSKDHKLVTALAKKNPTVIAFIGYGEGNTRFGSVIKMAHLLSCVCHDVIPIVGFYQRRVYVNELQNTSLIVGLKYYARLLKHFEITADQPQQIRKQIAKCAFGLATAQQFSASDPSVFVNDLPSVESHIMYDARRVCKFNVLEIPLSCLQLAICNLLVAGSKCIEGKTNENNGFDEWCRKEIKKRNLHVLIPLICEIDLIRLSIDTLENLRSGDPDLWREIDHLQFLTAVLRGHWGMNSLTVIKECATFHLMKVMSDLEASPQLQDDHKLIHNYKLCCMCYVLLCDDNFVRIGDKKYDKYDIIACTYPHPQLYDVTATGFSTSMSVPKINKFLQRFPDESKLPAWIDLYRSCRYIPDCVKLYNDIDGYTSWPIINHTFRGPQKTNQDDWYQYTSDEFLLAMGALSDYVKDTKDTFTIGESQEILQKLETAQEIPEDEKQKIQKIREQLKKHSQVSKLDRNTILKFPKIFGDCLRKHVIRPTLYGIKRFDNIGKGFGYFDESKLLNTSRTGGATGTTNVADDTCNATNNYDDDETQHITFFEMKVLLDYDYASVGKKNIAVKELRKCYAGENTTREIANSRRFDAAKSKAENENFNSLVNFCRFVFARFNNPAVDNEISGILLFTDSHYGDTLINLDHKKHRNELCTKCSAKSAKGKPLFLRHINDCSSCQKRMREITLLQGRLQTKLCDKCWNRLYELESSPTMDHLEDDCEYKCKERIQNENLINEDILCVKCKSTQPPKSTIKEVCTNCHTALLTQAKNVQFPFKKIGRLTLKYDGGNQLDSVTLSECTYVRSYA